MERKKWRVEGKREGMGPTKPPKKLGGRGECGPVGGGAPSLDNNRKRGFPLRPPLLTHHFTKTCQPSHALFKARKDSP